MNDECLSAEQARILCRLLQSYRANNPDNEDRLLFERGRVEVPPQCKGVVSYPVQDGVLYLTNVGMDYFDCTMYLTYFDTKLLDSSPDQIQGVNDTGRMFEPPVKVNDEIRLEIFNLNQGATQLTEDLTDDGLTVHVNSTEGFDDAGTIRIGDEKINYTRKTSTSFAGCTRGAVYTTAATHAKDDWAYLDYNIKVFNVLFKGWIRPGRK